MQQRQHSLFSSTTISFDVALGHHSWGPCTSVIALLVYHQDQVSRKFSFVLRMLLLDFLAMHIRPCFSQIHTFLDFTAFSNIVFTTCLFAPCSPSCYSNPQYGSNLLEILFWFVLQYTNSVLLYSMSEFHYEWPISALQAWDFKGLDRKAMHISW